MTRLFIIFIIMISFIVESKAQYLPGFYVQGRHLYDRCGEKVILRGVANPNIWFQNDGKGKFEEIEKTGANVIRIVWETRGSVDQLDAAITNCIDLQMIPMVELHDATGDWSKLQICVDYWTRSDVANMLINHEQYLLINIANECGDYSLSPANFKTGYESAIKQIRDAGIHVPLIIDGSDWGKNVNILQSTGPYLIEADPDHNLLFSVHMWWPKMYGFSESDIKKEIEQSVAMNLPLIVGEFSQMHGSCNDAEITTTNSIAYKTILKQCYLNNVGWIAWSWFGNCNPFWDMSSTGTFDSLYDWGLEVAVTDSFSIQNTSVRPYFITHGECNPNIINNNNSTKNTLKFELGQNYPNPFNLSTRIRYEIAETAFVSLKIFDIQGKLIKILISTRESAGTYSAVWDGKDNDGYIVSSGTYIYQLTVKKDNEIFKKASKLVLIK